MPTYARSALVLLCLVFPMSKRGVVTLACVTRGSIHVFRSLLEGEEVFIVLIGDVIRGVIPEGYTYMWLVKVHDFCPSFLCHQLIPYIHVNSKLPFKRTNSMQNICLKHIPPPKYP